MIRLECAANVGAYAAQIEALTASLANLGELRSVVLVFLTTDTPPVERQIVLTLNTDQNLTQEERDVINFVINDVRGDYITATNEKIAALDAEITTCATNLV